MFDACQPDLVSVMTAARTAENQLTSDSTASKFQVPIEQLKIVERSYMFGLSCMNKIVTLKQLQAVRRHKAPAGSQHSESIRSSRRVSMSSENTVSEAVEETVNDLQDAIPASESVPLSESMPLDSHNLARAPPASFVAFSPNNIDPGRAVERRINQIPRNPLTEVSSSKSHMKNLNVLLGIAFFGASITWSTVFSGTRGDLVLISWSACLFIVGAIGAAAASMLVLPEEDIVAKHIQVRWTVRILSLCSMAHVLGGMFLVAIALLVLDPTQQNSQALGGRAATRSAGVYAIAVSMSFVGVSGAVWRRYTVRTWSWERQQ
ncbi:hypothetical protein K438DRAFT_1161860 [Mycena galopus ATCC 62051]|nr:hypothetical protein K438DRAFT_1161860 [Mycena galopus ATCC 62051]